MSLLGTPLLVVLVVAALAMPAVAVATWGRVRGPRWAAVAQRATIVLVAQVMALAVALVGLNDYGQFFTSWSDLLGTGQPARVVAMRHYGADAVNPAPVVRARAVTVHTGPPPGVQPTGWSPRAQWSRVGAVMRMQVTGRVTGLAETALVYLPPAYFRGSRALPMVEVFSGYPGSIVSLADRLDYPSHLLAGLRAGTAKPMVLVMVRPSVTYPRDTECTNVPHGPQAFTFFASDVPASVRRTFGLRPTAYAAMGDSTGGMCATKLAVIDPQRFRAAVSLSGYYHAVTDFTTGNLYGSAAVRHANDIMWRLAHLPLPRVSLLVGTAITEGGADGYASAQRLLALVHPPMSVDEIVLSRGGHNFATWNLEIPRAITWLSRHLAG